MPDLGQIQSVKPEAHLKAAVIERLLATGSVAGDAVIISEMALSGWTRRADIVLANGHLCAFEIKSDADSLTRLPGQITDFTAAFEQLVIVVAPRFESRLSSMLPAGIGLWVAERLDEVRLIEKKRAKVRPLSSKAAIHLMTATELRALLAANAVPGIRAMTRAGLEEAAACLPRSDLASAARQAVKRRYRDRHDRFMVAREAAGTLACLDELARPRPTVLRAVATNEASTTELTIPPDHPMLVLTPGGPVLRRRV